MYALTSLSEVVPVTLYSLRYLVVSSWLLALPDGILTIELVPHYTPSSMGTGRCQEGTCHSTGTSSPVLVRALHIVGVQ